MWEVWCVEKGENSTKRESLEFWQHFLREVFHSSYFQTLLVLGVKIVHLKGLFSLLREA